MKIQVTLRGGIVNNYRKANIEIDKKIHLPQFPHFDWPIKTKATRKLSETNQKTCNSIFHDTQYSCQTLTAKSTEIKIEDTTLP